MKWHKMPVSQEDKARKNLSIFQGCLSNKVNKGQVMSSDMAKKLRLKKGRPSIDRDQNTRMKHLGYRNAVSLKQTN